MYNNIHELVPWISHTLKERAQKTLTFFGEIFSITTLNDCNEEEPVVTLLQRSLLNLWVEYDLLSPFLFTSWSDLILWLSFLLEFSIWECCWLFSELITAGESDCSFLTNSWIPFCIGEIVRSLPIMPKLQLLLRLFGEVGLFRFCSLFIEEDFWRASNIRRRACSRKRCWRSS